jgi:hypothetical protein
MSALDAWNPANVVQIAGIDTNASRLVRNLSLLKKSFTLP